jgi:hypothetical protein
VSQPRRPECELPLSFVSIVLTCLNGTNYPSLLDFQLRVLKREALIVEFVEVYDSEDGECEEYCNTW